MQLPAIVGPTASGKTRMGVEVALGLATLGHPTEIVSCDSMAVYRGLDIAADKPSDADRRGVTHHLLDVAECSDDVTAVRYRELARAAIDDIAGRGSVPLLVGGSGLWFRAAVDDLEFAPTSRELRSRLEASDPDELYTRLADADPDSAKRIDRRNPRRIVRAVEILELTGRPWGEFRTSWECRCGPYDVIAVALTWDRVELFRRAEERVERELAAGLADEVRGLLQSGISRTARQALGVKEIAAWIEGHASLDEAKALLVANTKKFIRRQLSWFRADPRVEWIDASKLGWDGARDEIVSRFAAGLAGS
jgi:tRNA dimethylallyltransferase